MSSTATKPNPYKLKKSLRAKKNWLNEFHSNDYPGRVKTQEYYQYLEAANRLEKQIKALQRQRKGAGHG